MPRLKAVTTHVRELAKTYSSEQLKEMADLLSQEAEKPRLDKKQYGSAQKEIRAAKAKLSNAEEKLSTLLAASGRTNDEINEEILQLHRDAERERVANPAVPGKRRGRPRKVQEEAAA